MSLDSIRARAAACDRPDCDIKALLAVADAAAAMMGSRSAREWQVRGDALRTALAALEASK